MRKTMSDLVITVDDTTPNGVVRLHTLCDHCFADHTILVDVSALALWAQRVPVQEAFPSMTPEDRELHFMTGLCPDCWIQTIAPRW